MGALSGNQLRVYVDGGPAGTGYNANRLYADITVCQAGSTVNCQTIDHILVDTGSTGLRVLSSVLSPSLGLSRSVGSNGFQLLNCAQFVDHSFAWGPVALADVRLGGKTAALVPIQIIGDPAYATLTGNCSSGTNITSAATLGANGILGVGLFKEDCGTACTVNFPPNFYFNCTAANCTSVQKLPTPLAQQIKNPVAAFSGDNNGVVINLPAAADAQRSPLVGTLTFGISSASLPSATVLKANAVGYIGTTVAGRVMANSFLDTGSNGLFFDTPSLPVCPGSPSFYCPAVGTNFAATLTGLDGATATAAFTVNNATASFTGGAPVLPFLAGSFGDARTFDWGLPFFYGRRVAFGIDGMASPLGTGPFYAF